MAGSFDVHEDQYNRNWANPVVLRLMRWLRLIGWLRWEGLRGEKSEKRRFFLFWAGKEIWPRKGAKRGEKEEDVTVENHNLRDDQLQTHLHGCPAGFSLAQDVDLLLGRVALGLRHRGLFLGLRLPAIQSELSLIHI